MFKDKKALSTAIYIIVMFAFITVTYIFYSVLVYQTGSEYILNNLADVSISILNETSIPAAQGIDTINQLEVDYNNLNMPYDIFFLGLWISAFVFSIVSTIRSKKEGIFSFFGMIFVGTLILLVLTSYVATFTSWFMTEIFGKLFADSTISTPILAFYLNNLGIINFIWWILLVLLSVVDRGMVSRAGEVQE